MKRSTIPILTMLAVAAVLCGPASAQVFYSFPGARTVPDTSPALGLTTGFGDQFFRLLGFARFNAAQRADLGFELVYDDLDTGPGSEDSGRFGGGLDFKYAVVPGRPDSPVDVAVQVGAGVLTRSEVTLVKVPFGALVSHTFPLSGNREVVPYGGVYLVIDYVNYDSPRLDDGTDLDVEMRLGGSVEIGDHASVFAAFHTGNGTMFFLGFSASL